MMKTTENRGKRNLYTDCFSAQHLVPGVTATLLQHIHLKSPQSCDAMNVTQTAIKQKTHWWLLRPGVGLEDRK